MGICFSLVVVLTGLTTLFSHNAYVVYKRKRLLKLAGIPYIVLPFPESPLKYQVLRELPIYKAFVHYLLQPLGFGGFDDYLKRNWRLNRRTWTKDFGFGKFGNIYCQVSPQYVQFEVADRDFVNYITGREGRDKFDKPKWQYRMLGIYGENIITSIDAIWPKHRRVAAPAFNERNYALVWSTSIDQALEMEYHWTSRESPSGKAPCNAECGEVVIQKIGQDAKQFALNVLSLAAFGIDIPFSKAYRERNSVGAQLGSQKEVVNTNKSCIFDSRRIPSGFSMTFEKAISYTTEHFESLLILVNTWPFWDHKNKDGIQTLPEPKFISYLPRNLRTNFLGWLDIGRYLGTLINLERESVLGRNKYNTRRQGTDNLLSLMVQNAVNLERGRYGKDGAPSGLTAEELVGNAYIFALAGHETTTGIIEFALVLLSLYQDAQSWFLIALDEELADLPEDPKEWKYDDIFKKFISCKCLMFEILRLFSPVPLVPKWVDPKTFPQGTTVMIPQRGSPNGQISEWKALHLPGGTIVNVSCYGLHYHPHYWGPDVSEFRPSRWDSSRDSHRKEWLAQFTDPDMGNELRDSSHAEPGLYIPPKGQYIPFGYGHRACLGRKFALVEFVAAMAVLFKNWRVELADVSGGKKTRQELEKDVLDKIEETSGGITTRIAQHVPLKLIRRSRNSCRSNEIFAS